MRKSTVKKKAKKKAVGKAKTARPVKAKGKSAAKVKAKARGKAKVKSLSRAKAGRMATVKRPSGKLIRFELDGKECKAKAGQTIVEAAKANGIYIPVLCYFQGLKPAGICRICTVRVGGRNMAGCTTPVTEGMIIESNIPELEDMRKAMVEMLFVEGNHLCPTCEKSGNCDLQALGYRYQMMAPRFPYQFPLRKVDATYTKIMIDNNRCVQCRRCVRGITTKDGRNIFSMTNRSGKSTIIADHELEAKMSDALATKAMDQCPVGAILKKEVGFAVPIGKRKYDKAQIGSEVHE